MNTCHKTPPLLRRNSMWPVGSASPSLQGLVGSYAHNSAKLAGLVVNEF